MILDATMLNLPERAIISYLILTVVWAIITMQYWEENE